MISRKYINLLEFIEFLVIAGMHVLYALLWMEGEGANSVVLYGVVTILGMAGCLYLVKSPQISQVGYILCIVTSCQFIGTEMRTLPYALFIYMVVGTLISINGNVKLNVYYFIIVNISVVLGLCLQGGFIFSIVSVPFYIFMIVFFEIFAVTTCFLVFLYSQRVEEIETQNKLLNIAQKSKDDFLANMSHEIRTPMNAIVSMSELIVREESTTDTVREYCHNIQNSGENLLGIINDILDFSKLESGKMDIVYEPYSIAAVIQDVANTAMFHRGYKDIEVIIDCRPDMPRVLLGDELRNRQILMNIVNNAVKFTEEGFVFISLSCYERDGKNWLNMTVKDTGIGIKEEDQENLFESFHRVDTTRNRAVEGTGLGLAISKRLVESMQGTIRIESIYGEGTTVYVDIPQEITEPEPLLIVENAQAIKVLLFGNREHYSHEWNNVYRQVNKNIWTSLNISWNTTVDFVELMEAVEKKEFTHLYVGAAEYIDNQEYINKIAKNIKVFVIYNPQYPMKLDSNVTGVQMPFYSINLVSALNGEAFFNQYIDKKKAKITFRAPFARVLVVDDNEINLRVAEGVLKLYEIQCVLAKSGMEAIEILKDQDIDIVFMDHMMPEMDGIEATKIIRRTGGEYAKNLPIIALTANVVNDAKSTFLANDFQDFVPKPISLKTMEKVLRRWLPGTKIELIDETARKQVPDFDIISDVKTESEKVVLSPKKEKASQQPKEPVFVNTQEKETTIQYMHIDEKTALENMGNQRDLYKELLEYCLEMEEQRKTEIQESFAAKDWEEYAIRVHALKGSMRSLGIEEIAKVAQDQERAAKDGKIGIVTANHMRLLVEYDRAQRSIEHFLETYQI